MKAAKLAAGRTGFRGCEYTGGGVAQQLPEVIRKFPHLKNRDEVHAFSLQEPEKFWGTIATQRLKWNSPYFQVRDTDMQNGTFKWFLGGTLNVSENCVDRHAKETPDKVALIWEKDEPGTQEYVTYGDLLKLVNQFANLLRANGVKKGDRVTLYMPNGPFAVGAMLGCARIGAVHNVVFAGFSADALAARIIDSSSEVVITMNQGVRGGKVLELKSVVDAAVEKCPGVRTVLVGRRTNASFFLDHKTQDLDKELSKQSTACEPAVMDSEDPLFMLYTSGSTGKPKGLVHSQAGYLLYAMLTQKLVFDYQSDDVFGCVADIGWITGHTYGVYGPLANGATSVLFESVPVYPDPVGEPINHEAWDWYHKNVGQRRCMVVDTWWQTETGGICIAPSPADPGDLIKPAEAMRPFYGINPVLVDDKHQVINSSPAYGSLCLTQPWPSMARTIHGDHDRYIKTYFRPFDGVYFTGDGAHTDERGFFAITGRMDDVINVSGHRLGTAEVEDVLDDHEDVAETAVIGYPHEVKGEAFFAFVTLKEGIKRPEEEIRKELCAKVKKSIASYAVPDKLMFAPGLPKTRSGKIMRRILRKIAMNSKDLGDISTLADPSVVEKLVIKFSEMKT